MHRERVLDFWLTLFTVGALFVPIWGILLEPSGLISVPDYLLYLGSPALAYIIGVLIYAYFRNKVLLNRFLIGYLGGLIGSFIIYISLIIGRAIGIAPDLTGILGKMMFGVDLHHPVTTGIFAGGLVYHYLLNGAAWGAAYALVFGKSPWWFGAIAGIGIAAILLISPPFYRFGFNLVGIGRGSAMLASIIFAHILYGGAIGIVVHRYVFPEVGIEGAKAVKPTYA